MKQGLRVAGVIGIVAIVISSIATVAIEGVNLFDFAAAMLVCLVLTYSVFWWFLIFNRNKNGD